MLQEDPVVAMMVELEDDLSGQGERREKVTIPGPGTSLRVAPQMMCSGFCKEICIVSLSEW